MHSCTRIIGGGPSANGAATGALAGASVRRRRGGANLACADRGVRGFRSQHVALRLADVAVVRTAQLTNSAVALSLPRPTPVRAARAGEAACVRRSITNALEGKVAVITGDKGGIGRVVIRAT